MSANFIAHTKKDPNGSLLPPQTLEDHLDGVANKAEKFAAEFSSAAWGSALGVAHDVGKCREEWQKYILAKSEEDHSKEGLSRVQHSIHGAKLCEDLYGKGIGRVLSYCIAGHHTGLPDWSPAEGQGKAALSYRLSQIKDLSDIDILVQEKVKQAKPSQLPWRFSQGLDVSLWIRMLFSCLVDADYLDTEAYMDPEKSKQRSGYCSISELLERLREHNQQLDKTAEDTPVNQIRREIRQKCIDAAQGPQGIFSLSVPTGGGKTLSSLTFALEHAKKHNLKRIIYVIPYTSIIEQNANVFKKALDEDQVIEHHSNFDDENAPLKLKLATENWDAPVVVTTSVQFFESLFAARPGRCRKLHNIAKSVVILDEAQLVPVDYLAPILETMQLLVDHYQVSFVISTATQPAFGENTSYGKFFKGLRDIREIMGGPEEVKKLYDSLKRVQIQLPTDFHAVSNWGNIALELRNYKQVLCVVSDRKSCRQLHKLMPEGTYHLSALMCGQHRSDVIKEIKDKLDKKETVRVISTQLVEAGVDFDFPVVYRALAGLDSIVQAAGRCNREGKLESGKVVVFVPPKKAPPGFLRKAAETTSNILASLRGEDPLNESIFKRYFAELYWKVNSLDAKDIISLLKPDPEDFGMFFRTAAERFCIIDDSQQKTILVRYGEGDKLIDTLKKHGPDRQLMRKLQRYTVNVYNEEFDLLLRRGSIEEVQPGIFALTSSVEYSKEIGLMI